MINTVLVVGASGVLGSQIALQTAVNGCRVIGWCLNEEEIAHARRKMARFAARYEEESVDHVKADAVQAAMDGIEFVTALEGAAEQADLIIEAIVENQAIKEKVFAELAQLKLPEHTIITTNTSSLRPSDLMASTGRPDRFLALHFLNEIWRHNIAEIMPTSQTCHEVTQAVVAFAEKIRMIPAQIRKEQPGYIMNTLYIPYLGSAVMLWAMEKGRPWEIDQAWMKATGTWIGPFGNIDSNGFGTVVHIFEASLNKNAYPEEIKRQARYTVRFFKDMIGHEAQRENAGSGGFLSLPGRRA